MVWEELAAWGELEASAVREKLATAPRNYPRVEAAIDGNITLNIVEAHRTGTGQPRTGLGARCAVIRSRTVRQAPVNS